jgi:hypothetical protein
MTNTSDKLSGGGGDVAPSPRSPASSEAGRKLKKLQVCPSKTVSLQGCTPSVCAHLVPETHFVFSCTRFEPKATTILLQSGILRFYNDDETAPQRLGNQCVICPDVRILTSPGSGFLNRLSGVRLSPGPPSLPLRFHQVDSSRSNSKHALKQCSVIKVSYFFARALTFQGTPSEI